jgi:hypothetical protein
LERIEKEKNMTGVGGIGPGGGYPYKPGGSGSNTGDTSSNNPNNLGTSSTNNTYNVTGNEGLYPAATGNPNTGSRLADELPPGKKGWLGTAWDFWTKEIWGK